jgi:DnaJ-class molecular chaperone
MKDYYRILGVLDDAEDIIIKAAYRALAQRYHPDKWGGNQNDANKRMAEINEAYNELSDTARRKKYDEEFFQFKSRNQESDEPSETFDEEELKFISEYFECSQRESKDIVNLLDSQEKGIILSELKGVEDKPKKKKKIIVEQSASEESSSGSDNDVVQLPKPKRSFVSQQNRKSVIKIHNKPNVLAYENYFV